MRFRIEGVAGDRQAEPCSGLAVSVKHGAGNAEFAQKLQVFSGALGMTALFDAIVVAEDDWWGSRAAGQDIDDANEPIRAIFEKYYFDAPSPRVFPAAIADDWFCRKTSEVDGVIFYLPHDDDVIGWDYPRLRTFLDERAIPHLMLRS